MALIKSISGIRGTIGGTPGDNLTPIDIAECTAAYGSWLLDQKKKALVVVGRDARPSGKMVSQIAVTTLQALGIDVIDLGLTTTPTVEMAIPHYQAGGGIIFTASHNPVNWNALKLLNHKGEFISKADGEALLDKLNQSDGISFAQVENLGNYRQEDFLDQHLQAILELPLVDAALVRERGFKVVVDAVNSTGAPALGKLLDKMGCKAFFLNDDVSGVFAHNPEPLPGHLGDLSKEVLKRKADIGFAVDPDVDRLALVCEDGSFFGEEYTLVAIADYYLSEKSGVAVSNLSSSRALRDVARRHGGEYAASAVGEVNVVQLMKDRQARIGGEGNGGIIVPELHYGRDALAGAALLLTYLAKKGGTLSELRANYPKYEMIKDKIQLLPDMDVDDLLKQLEEEFSSEDINTTDGLKIDFETGWVHLRKSNTEPILRVYAEAPDETQARAYADKLKYALEKLTK